MNEDRIENVELYPLAEEYQCLYGVNVNIQRAIPEVYDGLKPVHRRLLYTMFKGRAKFSPETVETLGGSVLQYHPHGNLGMKDIIAGLAQKYSNNVPLFDAHGSAGTKDIGNNSSAGRYWKVSLSKFAYDVLFDEFDGKVDMRPNYDNSREEPIILPAKFPIILLNGTMGIGYTLSCDIYPYNLSEIADATIKLLKNPKANIHLVPDSPTGCDIIIKDEESFWMQSCFDIDNVNYTITFTKTPYKEFQKSINDKLCAIQDSNNPIPEIISADMENDLPNDKLRYIIRCKPCNLYQVLNKLFKRVDGLRVAISARNMLVVDKGMNHKYNVKQILLAWIRTRVQVKRAWFLRKTVQLKTDINMLEGKMFMLSPKNLQTTIKTFKDCKTKEDIIPALVKVFHPDVSTSQARYMMDVKMYQLTHEEFLKTEKKIEELTEELDRIEDIVKDPQKINDVIINELKQIKDDYGYPRRSKIINMNTSDVVNVGCVQILSDGSFILTETENPEHLSSDVIPIQGNEVCLIDEKGQFVWLDTTKLPHNTKFTLTSVGKVQMGKCVMAVSNTSHKIAILSNKGRIKYMPIDKLQVNTKKPLIPLDVDEEIVSILDIADEHCDILMYTPDGYGKRFNVSELNEVASLDSVGQFIMKEDHGASGMFMLNPKKPLLMYVTRLGRMRLNESRFLISGKKFGNTQPLIKLSANDDLIAVLCVTKDQTITLNHADSRVTTVHVDSIDPTTMSMPPVHPKHVPGVKVIRAFVS